MFLATGAGGPGLSGMIKGFYRGKRRLIQPLMVAPCLPVLFASVIISGGCLEAGEYVSIDVERLTRAPDERGSVMPDFSHAGYMGGGAALPDVPAVKELSPLPDGDDRERIQSALDEIGAMEPDGGGFRGALLLRAGEYRVHGSLRIEKSGVVLRGEGQSPDGTIIRGTKKDPSPRTEKHSLIYLAPEITFPRRHVARYLDFLERGAETVIVDRQVPVGSRTIHVENAGGFNAGDEIVIEIRPNEKWVDTMVPDGRSGWNPRMYHAYERTIKNIEGNRFTLDAPMVHFMDRDMVEKLSVWKSTDNTRISQGGVEHLRLVGPYSEAPPRANGNDGYKNEDCAWSGIWVEKARDCWVRNVTTLHFLFSAVAIRQGSRNITVQDSAYLRPVSLVGASRRYPFHVAGSMNLIQRCYAREARHAFVSSSRVTGPNVFLDCLSEKSIATSGPHGALDTGFLYDNIAESQGRIEALRVRWSGGWTGVNHVLWNCKAGGWIICDEPHTGDRNWSVGNVAPRRIGDARDLDGTWVSHGRHVKPRSLYLWQLEKRLGTRAVENITIDIQRQPGSEKIFDYLKNNFAELTGRELEDDDNLFGNPDFRSIATYRGGNPWEFRSGDENSGWEIICALEAGGVISKTENPAWGDSSALELPAGDLRHRWSSAFKYPDPSVGEYDYILSFDYMAPKGSVLKTRINRAIITRDREAESNWKCIKSFSAADAAGRGKWQGHSFKFSLAPGFDEDSKMPYTMIFRMTFSSEEEFSFANPSLEIVKREAPRRGPLEKRR